MRPFPHERGGRPGWGSLGIRHRRHPIFDQRKSLWAPRRRGKGQFSEQLNKSYQLRNATLA